MADRQKQAQIDLHRKHARNYHRVRTQLVGTRLFNEYWDDEIRKWLPNGRDLRVLDDMCGTGIFLGSLARKYSFVLGTDVSLDMISLTAPETRRQIKGLIRCEAERLPFVSESFDLVNIRGALHHVNPAMPALGEIARVLRAGGMLIVSEPCDDFILVRKMRERMYRRLEYFAEDEKTFLSADLVAAINAAGLTVDRTKRFGFIGYTLLGYPDVIPALEWINHVPFACTLGKALVGVDKLLARMPIVKNWSLIVFVAASKPVSARAGAPV